MPVSKCLQGKSSGHKKCSRKRVTAKRDDREAGETGALGPISEVRGNCPAVEC